MPPIDLAALRAILLDIEGTTTPLDFVHRTLFGYARENLHKFLERHHADAAVKQQIAALKEQYAGDLNARKALPAWSTTRESSAISSATQYALWLMDQDSKTGALKALQGMIWQEGYSSGKLKGEVYADVPPLFERLREQGKKICIYSSGSELAQRLLFSSTQFGDLTVFIAAFFDTRAGAKAAAKSYNKIASSMGVREKQILFLSDAQKELDAARSAGIETALVVRGEQSTASAHRVVRSFEELA